MANRRATVVLMALAGALWGCQFDLTGLDLDLEGDCGFGYILDGLSIEPREDISLRVGETRVLTVTSVRPGGCPNLLDGRPSFFPRVGWRWNEDMIDVRLVDCACGAVEPYMPDRRSAVEVCTDRSGAFRLEVTGRKPGSTDINAFAYLPQTPSCTDPEIKYAPYAFAFRSIRVTE